MAIGVAGNTFGHGEGAVATAGASGNRVARGEEEPLVSHVENEGTRKP